MNTCGRLLLLLLLLLSCEDSSEKKSGKAARDSAVDQDAGAPSVEVHSDSFPGHDPPELEELLRKVQARSPAKGDASPYKPREVEVPPVQTLDESVLPKTSDGAVFLNQTAAVGLSYKKTFDPISAMASSPTARSSRRS